MIAVLNRQPPSIIGDGVKATAELVAARDKLRMSTNNVVHKRLPVDESLQVLAQQGFSRSYVSCEWRAYLAEVHRKHLIGW